MTPPAREPVADTPARAAEVQRIAGDEQALSREYVYYDPIYTLPQAGQDWWRSTTDLEATHEAALVGASASRAASAADLL